MGCVGVLFSFVPFCFEQLLDLLAQLLFLEFAELERLSELINERLDYVPSVQLVPLSDQIEALHQGNTLFTNTIPANFTWSAVLLPQFVMLWPQRGIYFIIINL